MAILGRRRDRSNAVLKQRQPANLADIAVGTSVMAMGMAEDDTREVHAMVVNVLTPQKDTEAYYIIGFRSNSAARDGKYRHLSVKVNRSDLALEYMPGYYAAADFQHQKTEDLKPALNTHFRRYQHRYVMYEVYDPARGITTFAPDAVSESEVKGRAQKPGTDGIHVLTSIEFLSGGGKVFETPLVKSNRLNVSQRGAVSFQFDGPL